jgi:TetR/AcrR family transcriptional regulator, transcriptional repressor for nem operon
MSGDTRDRIMEAARLTVQDLGYNGLSFRELAKDVGIKSASIHYYFPTKSNLCEAIVRRYIDRYERYLQDILNDATDSTTAMRRYTDVFRDTLLNGNRMCLAGILAAERNDVPAEVRTEVVRWGEMNERWIGRVLAPGVDNPQEDIRRRAKAIFAAVSGAQMIAHGRGEVAFYDEVVSAYRESGFIP